MDKLRGPGVETLAFDALHDNGFQVQASVMAMPGTIQLYSGASYVSGEYGNPWDARLGVHRYPWKVRVAWMNWEYMYARRSPVGAASLPFVVGANGSIVYANFIINS